MCFVCRRNGAQRFTVVQLLLPLLVFVVMLAAVDAALGPFCQHCALTCAELDDQSAGDSRAFPLFCGCFVVLHFLCISLGILQLVRSPDGLLL